jgi:chemotaxis protein CheY-P-specific phosphatase CheC
MANVAIEYSGPSIREHLYLPPQEIEILYEAAQIGADGAIGSLQQFLGINTEIRLNCLSFLSLPILQDRLNLFYPNSVGYHIRFSGDVTGELFTFFSEKTAWTILDRVITRRWSLGRRQMNKIEISALSELVNIISNSFWRVITEKSSLNWWISPPAKVNDLAKSVYYTCKVYSVDSLMIQIEYFIPDLNARIQFVILPTQYTLKKILFQLENKI